MSDDRIRDAIEAVTKSIAAAASSSRLAFTGNYKPLLLSVTFTHLHPQPDSLRPKIYQPSDLKRYFSFGM